MACSHALVAGQQKKKPWGSGTTSNVRRAKRANIQWDYLEEQGADTDTPRGLAKHVAALERATQKAKAKLNGQEEEQEPLEKGASSRGRSSTPKAKPLEKGQRASRSSSKKGKPLEKGKGKGQGKGPRTTRSRRRPRRRSTRPTTMWGGKGKEEEYSYYTGSETESSTEPPKRNTSQSPPCHSSCSGLGKEATSQSPPATPPAQVLEKIPENEVKQNAQQALERAGAN